MNCESKICVLENVQTVNSVISVRQKKIFSFFFIKKIKIIILLVSC